MTLTLIVLTLMVVLLVPARMDTMAMERLATVTIYVKKISLLTK